MKLHRFYVDDMPLTHELWVKNQDLLHQWNRVLRFDAGRELVLFNDLGEQKLYRISKIGMDAILLNLVTDMESSVPKRDLYLCFSLLKKDKNDWVLQKGTELGVCHFIPLICDRTEKTGFDVDRAIKIVIEAAEQCGRSDIPKVRDPIKVSTAIEELKNKNVALFVAEQGGVSHTDITADKESVAVFIGPEGGWTENEKQHYIDSAVEHISLGKFTLRAETAAITAAGLLQ